MNDYKIEGRPSTIFRTLKNKDNPYVMIDRRPIDNPSLSFKAKGILTYLMSRPDGWEVSITDLVKHSKDGEASIRTGLKELREAGHMKYAVSRKEGRITGWLIEVYEVPLINPQPPDSDFQQVENLQVENQEVENRTQVLSTLSNTESKLLTKIPKNSEVSWMLAAGVDSCEISKLAEKEAREKEVADLWETEMHYNPLPWWTDKDLGALLKFLLSKTPDEIRTFAAWSKRNYSTFNPDKARDKPRRVIELWPRAFEAAPEALSWVEIAQKERANGYPD